MWRLGSTLNLSTPLAATISITALVAELMLLGTSFLQLWFSLWPERPLPAPGLKEPAASAWPGVDVLVPSYGEPPELIERCLRGCLALDYPHHTVWLLDDSGRPELEALCGRLGVRYLAREEREHAKAGNLNHALQHCTGELIAVFDADVVPLTPFLRRTATLFADPAVGFVQTPQSYMNADPVMRNLRLERWLMPDEESFYRWVEPTRDAVGAVVCAGTSFVMRRAALDAVGGFETGTPSEDLATGIRLTAAGYTNRFLPEKLSAGLAPFTAAAMARQRSRWASGTVQTLRTRANPLTIPGLNPLQRLAYLEGIAHWFNVLPQLLLVLMPLSLGVLGVAPIVVSGEGLLWHALPFYGAQLLLTRWLSGQARTPLLPELYRWIFLMPVAAGVAGTLVGQPQRFRVTPKALARGRRIGPAKRLVVPLLFLLTLQLVALANLLRPALGLALAPLSTATLTINLTWAGLNLLLLLLALRCCFDRPGLSEAPWFAVQLPGVLTGQGLPASGVGAQITAVSEAGVELRAQAGATLAEGARGAALSLELPSLPPLPIAIQTSQGNQLGYTWGSVSDAEKEQLQAFLYRRPALWPARRAPFEPLSLLVVLLRLLIGCRPETWFNRSALPQHS
ncbi:glycosyltransferase [Synechococcus sp. FGCU-3]|nr:glycosyltransferase [Synechococcus sp. FGCU3]